MTTSATRPETEIASRRPGRHGCQATRLAGSRCTSCQRGTTQTCSCQPSIEHDPLHRRRPGRFTPAKIRVKARRTPVARNRFKRVHLAASSDSSDSAVLQAASTRRSLPQRSNRGSNPAPLRNVGPATTRPKICSDDELRLGIPVNFFVDYIAVRTGRVVTAASFINEFTPAKTKNTKPVLQKVSKRVAAAQ